MAPGGAALVVDDEPQIRRVVANSLRGIVDRVLEASTGRAGIDLAAAERPVLIVLDLGLPDMDGMGVCTEIRSWSDAPIIVLSARHSDGEKVRLLDAGADDYITKPFSPAEFQARARAQLRRARGAVDSDDTPFTAGGLVVDVARRTVSRGGAPIHLTPTEWDLLRVFIRHAGRTLTHQQIIREVWRGGAGDAQSYLRVHIANLRRKIEGDPVRPRLIITEPSVGYRLEAPAD
ncbi:MAG TPA: response regulator transcription factor [Longimicrobiales bacterium]|nr:response regulator transcription factor [Longimicrobiales bacterium]